MWVFILSISLLAVTPSLGFTNLGNNFYVGFPRAVSGGLSGTSSLTFVGENATEISIQCLDPLINEDHIMPESGFLTVNIDNLVRSTLTPVTLKGVHVTSDRDVSVQVSYGTYGDMCWGLQVTEEFTDFIMATYGTISGNAAYILVIPTEEDTIITVYNTAGNEVDQVTIRDFQTYYYRSEDDDITGYRVTTSRPANVITGNENTNIISGNTSPIMTNVPPVNALGTQMIVPPISGGGAATYLVRVIAAYDNTSISTVHESLPDVDETINRGQIIEISVTPTETTLYVECSSPCLTVQYNVGGSSTTGAPYMRVIFPLDLHINDATFTTPPGTGTHIVSIVAESLLTPRVRLDGERLTGQIWRTVHGMFFHSYTTLSVSTGHHVLDVEDEEPGQHMMAYLQSATTREQKGSSVSFGVSDGDPPQP